MRSKRLLVSLLLVTAFIAVAAMPAAAGAKYILKVGYILPETQSDHIIMRDVFKKDVEELSKGQIAVELYPNAQLGGDRELIESVQLGTLEMAIPATSAIAGFEKRFQVFDLPFLFKSKEKAFQVLDGELGLKLNELLPPKGMVNLGYAENGFRHITNSRRPIHSPEDLKGLKLRTMENPLHMAFFSLLGANPTPMNFGELYTALQQGIVDAQENPVVLVYTSKFFEVQKFYSLTGHVFSATMLVTNKAFLDGLPDDLRKIVEDAARHYCLEQRKMADVQEKEFLEALKATGMEINELTDGEKSLFVEATLPVYDRFRGEIGDELVDMAKKVASE
ncbi:DctP family TRAP transporter solute-binding subunit [Aminithiophilus ramosus]|uniref:DctP family TRAP transporter solute-binding subunit n=1 Tax=Aminithiophilus ramosus TaxID=3029084 RepID=A0A9Q7ANR2_9BACT|nr:DctP family TRAP transporter solute-binding subunit [Aminithiophilus ramosus]QTX32192.1 DctP family TRAP transporter solute-binding subunit [Aminithiophilus ramosus]